METVKPCECCPLAPCSLIECPYEYEVNNKVDSMGLRYVNDEVGYVDEDEEYY